MDQQQTQDCVALLAAHFKLPMPTIRWSKRSRNGKYVHKGRVLLLGAKLWRGVLAGTVHEFAHYLQYMRRERTFANPKHHPLKTHGEEYQRALLDVVKLAYTDPTTYPWETEYKALRRYKNYKFEPKDCEDVQL